MYKYMPQTLDEQISWAYTLSTDRLTEPEQKAFLSFMFFFNIFEAHLFENGHGVNDLLKKINDDLLKESWFNINDYSFYGDFFKQRYVNADGKQTSHFRLLQLNQSRKKAVFDILAKYKIADDNSNIPDLFRAYLEIAYRFRNNLFHGSKGVHSLSQYTDCIEKINNLLYKLLTDMKSNGFHGLTKRYRV